MGTTQRHPRGRRGGMREFRVWREDEGDFDAWSTTADTAEWAAEEWAEHEDWSSAEYDIVSGRDEPVVCVRDVGTGEVTRWRVSGEAIPSYSAREATP
jgi:hypothetical protein